MSFEALLVLGAIGFYLYDSIELLHINEFALLRNGRRWSYAYPSPDWHLLRKWPFLPNPFRPDIDVFLVYWSTTPSTERRRRGIRNFGSRLAFLRQSARILFALLFMLLPAVALFYGSGPQLLAVFVCVYGTVGIVACLLWHHRHPLQLTRKRLFVLAFECLACPPFAVNVLRKVTARSAMIGDPIPFARRVLDRESFRRLVGDVCQRIEMQLCWFEEDSEPYASLAAYRDHLRGLAR